jgi:hypothetical protein
MTHTLLDLPDVQLTEEEVVLGAILTKSAQPRLRKDRMRLHAETLVRDICTRIAPAEEGQRTENLKVLWGSVAAVRLTTNRLHKTGYAVHHGFHNLT